MNVSNPTDYYRYLRESQQRDQAAITVFALAQLHGNIGMRSASSRPQQYLGVKEMWLDVAFSVVCWTTNQLNIAYGSSGANSYHMSKRLFDPAHTWQY